MAIDAAALAGHEIGERRQAYVERDVILYALGVGLPSDADDREELRFLDETRLAVLPAFAATLASPGMWIRDPRFGVDFTRLVHVAQDAAFHAPLPPNGDVVATARVASLHDRGAGRGAELVVERTIRDAATGIDYCDVRQTLLLRGDGGFGGQPPVRAVEAGPARKPDFATAVRLSPRAALIYRLSGDWNPLHIDPDFARAAGFERPIMHGLGVYGAVSWRLCQAIGVPAERLARMSCRFSGIVLPGETIDLAIWREGSGGSFIASIGDRRVLDHGRFEIASAAR